MNPNTPGRTDLILQSLSRAARLGRDLERLERKIKAVTVQVERHQLARLTVAGLLGLGLLAAAIKPGLNLAPLSILIFVPPFIWLVRRTRNWTRHLKELTHYRDFNTRQAARLSGRQPKAGIAPKLDGFKFPPDIGLFGSFSLWTLLDETLTEGGRNELARRMTAEPRSKDEILKAQAHIRDYRSESWFYTKLTFQRNDSEEFQFSAKQASTLLETPFVPAWFGLALVGLVIVWAAAITLILLGAQSGFAKAILPVYIAYFVLNYSLRGSGGSVFRKGLGLQHHLSQLAPIFEALEARTHWSEKMRILCPNTSLAGPSRQARSVGRLLGFLGVETNPLLDLLVNAAMPWSAVASWFLERRRRKISESFPICLQELAELEVLGSLVIFDRYQTSIYPELDSGTLRMSDVFHPLIDRNHVIANDFGFQDGSSLGLLTGSNMSGKSTFLRAVGLNQTLANMGAPVFASEFATSPMKIETCIEVSDSLRDGVSYFYAEVRRLKALLEQAKAAGQSTLFLIDEIFRGTNNKERQIGSRAVIRALARLRPKALGFVSTHDLELTVLEKEEPAVVNLHFRETIEAGQMVFSYRLNPGPSPTTNALLIMAMEGLPVDQEI